MFSADDISVVLAYYLEAELERWIAPLGAGAGRIQQKALELLENEEVRAKLKGRIPVEPGVDLGGILSDGDYLKRVAEIFVERVRGGPDAPSLRIAPEPLSSDQTQKLLGDGINFGLIFGAESIYFQDTVLAFQADESRSGSELAPKVNVLGVHMGWRTDDGKGAQRSLIVDETGLVKEVRFEEAVPLHIVQTLHLPREGERHLHREISVGFEYAGIEQINPYGASERADDKMWTHQLWAQHPNEIPSPAFSLIPRSSSTEEVVKELKRFWGGIRGWKGPVSVGLFLQPNTGTEGYKVERFEVDLAKIDEIDGRHPAVRYIVDSLLPEDDALLREERGNVQFCSGEASEKRSIAFRINVAWNGSEFVAESGYAQVTRDAWTFPASRGSGGTIVDIQEAFANLCYSKADEWMRFTPLEQDIAKMKEAAVNAAWGLNVGLGERDYLKLTGIDIVLEVEETKNGVKLIPVVLDANPRPAGLAQAREVMGISDEGAEPRISVGLFDVIREIGGRAKEYDAGKVNVTFS